MFDEENLVSHAGLVPVMELAERAGLSQLLDERGEIDETTVLDTVRRLTGHSAGTLRSYLKRPVVRDMLSASTSRPSARLDATRRAAGDDVDNRAAP